MVYQLSKKTPQIAASAWIAPQAVVVGDVTIGERSSIWYGCVLRGDVHSIRIGADTNIQDGCVIHVTAGKHATTLGDRITVGHRVLIHGATLHDDCFIGMAATILDGAVVEPFAFVGAGALVTPGMVVKSGWLALGSPAKLVREIKAEERTMMLAIWPRYVENARLHRESLVSVQS